MNGGKHTTGNSDNRIIGMKNMLNPTIAIHTPATASGGCIINVQAPIIIITSITMHARSGIAKILTAQHITMSEIGNIGAEQTTTQ